MRRDYPDGPDPLGRHTSLNLVNSRPQPKLREASMPTPWQMEPNANLAPGNLLAAKWCAEPSVHGGKARPKDAEFVM